MEIIKYLFRQSWKQVSGATVLCIVAGVSSAALITVITKAIDSETREAWQGPAFFLLCAVVAVTKSFSEIGLLRLTQSSILRLRISTSHKLLATPLKKLQELGKEGVMVIMTRDIDTFIEALQLLPMTFSNSIVIVACLGYLSWLSWQVLVIFLIMLVVCVIGFRAAERGPLQQLEKLREQTDVLYSNFRDLVDGNKELKLNAGRGKFFVDRVVTLAAQRFKDMFVSSMSRYTVVINVGTVLFYLMLGALLFVAPHWLPLSAPVLAGTTLILMYLIRPISEMLFALPALRQAAIALKKILELHDSLGAEPAELTGPDPFARHSTTMLELRDVCHRYTAADSDARFTLGPLNMRVERGEILFIVGGNGSGKTTLAMLLLGLYEPETGTLLLNGETVTPANVEYYRQRFSAVFADFHLFAHLGAPDDEMTARATHYLKAFGVAHKTQVVDGKFTTIDLSTGQRKRLALVSSYLEGREIYLFDEWAADQDPVFKRIFYTELLPELRASGKTVIVISHDDAYFSCADRVVKLVDGKLDDISIGQSPAWIKEAVLV